MKPLLFKQKTPDVLSEEVWYQAYKRLRGGEIDEQVLDYVKKAMHGCLKRYQKRSSQDTDDILQNIAVILLRNKDKVTYTDAASFHGWIGRVATNAVHDYFKKVHLKYEHQYEDAQDGRSTILDRSPALSLSPEQELIRNQRLQIMMHALKNLRQDYRSVLEMVYFQEMSYEEISVKLRLSIGATKSHIRRAKEALKVNISY